MLTIDKFNAVEAKMSEKDFVKVLSSANKTFCSLSNILRNLQTKAGWAGGGEALFQRLGLPLDRKLTAAKLAELVNSRINQKTGETEYIVTIQKFEKVEIQTKDSEGNAYTVKVNKKDAEGKEVFTLKETVVRTWSIRTLARLVLQSKA